MSVESLQEAIPELGRPFTAASVKFKIQTNPKDRGGRLSQALVVAFMDSRLAAARLNSVCPGQWTDIYAPAPMIQNGIECHLTVFGATRCDVGFVAGEKLNSDMGFKGLYSDAFKRAAVKFGIGAFLYALPKMYVKPEQLKQIGSNWYMTPACEQDLRNRYLQWLKAEGAERFGDPLDHGDHEDAQGDPDAEPGVAAPEDLAGGTTGAGTAPASANAGRASSSSARPAKHQSDVTPTPTPSTDAWTDATVQRLKDSGIWDNPVLLKEGLKEVGVVPTPGAQRKTTLFRLGDERREQFRGWIDRMAEQALVDAAKETLGAKETKA